MERKYWRGREVESRPEGLEGDPLGPDERDRDLLDDAWESSTRRSSSGLPAPWRIAGIALAILALLSILVPMATVLTR